MESQDDHKKKEKSTIPATHETDISGKLQETETVAKNGSQPPLKTTEIKVIDNPKGSTTMTADQPVIVSPLADDYNKLISEVAKGRTTIIGKSTPRTIELVSGQSSIPHTGFQKLNTYNDYQDHQVDLFTSNRPVSQITPAFIHVKAESMSFPDSSMIDDRVRHGLVNLSTVESITGASRELFNFGTTYVTIEPNPKFFEGCDLEFKYGVPLTKSLFTKLVSQTDASLMTLNKLRVASGFLVFALHFSLRSDQLLVVDESNTVEYASDLNYERPVSIFQGKKIVLPISPHVMLAETNVGMQYLSEYLRSFNDDGIVYKYGREEVLTRTVDRKPITESTFLNIDNVTAQAMGLTFNFIGRDQLHSEKLLDSLYAYAVPGSTIDCIIQDQQSRLFGNLLTPEQELSYLLVGTALSPDVYKTILRINLDTFLSFGTVVPSLEDKLSDVIPDAGNSEVLRLIRERKATSNFDQAMEYIVMQVTPSLVWPNVISTRPMQTGLSLYVMLIENILFFVLFPGLAKKCGAGLSNRIYALLSSIAPTEYNQFVTRVGYDGTPQSSVPISDDDYWENRRTPALFRDEPFPQAMSMFELVRTLIKPVGDLQDQRKAEEANFPRVNARSTYYNPYPNPGTEHIEDTSLKIRICQIFTEVYRRFLHFNRGGVLLSKNQLTGVTKLIDVITRALHHHGIGFGRDIGIPLAYLRNRKTFFLNDYDGNLGAPFTPPLCIVSRANSITTPILKVETRIPGQMLLETGAVWTLLLGLKFPSMGPNDDLLSDPVVRYNPPDPGMELLKDNEVIAMCANSTIPFGLAASIITENGIADGMPEVKELIGRKTLSSSEFRRLVDTIQSALLGAKLSIAENKDIFYKDEKIDVRCIDPVIRYVRNGVDILDPTIQDPPIVRGALKLLPEGLLERFRIGLAAIGDRSSQYSRLGKGIMLKRKECDVESPKDECPLDDTWPVVEFSNDLFGVRMIGNYHTIGLLFGGEYYPHANLCPHMCIVIKNSEYVTPNVQGYLLTALEERRIAVYLPNTLFMYQIISCLPLKRPDERVCVGDLLRLRNDAIPLLTFYDTELMYSLFKVPGISYTQRSRYIWPLTNISRHVVVRGLVGCEDDEPEGFEGPSMEMCDSGLIDPAGNVLFTNGVVKDPRKISLTNGVIAFTKCANLRGTISYKYKPPHGLDSY